MALTSCCRASGNYPIRTGASQSAGKATFVAAVIDGGKLRVTFPAWEDAVVLLPDQLLAASNREPQAPIVRGHRVPAERPASMKTAPRSPRPRRTHFAMTRVRAVRVEVSTERRGGCLRRWRWSTRTAFTRTAPRSAHDIAQRRRPFDVFIG